MKLLNPQWPASIPQVYRPVAQFKHGLRPYQVVDFLGLEDARRRRREHERAAGIITGSFCEQFFPANIAAATAFKNSSAEGSLLTGLVVQPEIPGNYFANNNAAGKTLRLVAKGVLSTTATPTITFQWRMGTTLGAATLTGTSIGVSAAITTGSGVSNVLWESAMDLNLNIAGIGTGNATLNGAGWVMSPGGFAAPYIYELVPSQGALATFTSTFDASLTQYINLSVTWSAASNSNTIQLLQLYGLMYS